MHGTWMDAGVSRKATEGAKGQESGVRNDRTGVPALRATLPCGSKFHGSDPGMAEQLQNCGVLRYAQAAASIAVSTFDFIPRPTWARPLSAPDTW